MKKLFKTQNILAYLVVFLSLFACRFNNNKHDNSKQVNVLIPEKPGLRMTDIQGAMEYEFNLLKNPYTNKIPEGIREAELAQAQEILENQLQHNGLLSPHSYTFQGPNNLGGRTRALVYDVRYNGTTNQTIFAGGVSGGVFKSTNDGATWIRKSPLTDLHSVTCIVQDPRVGFRDTWYYSTGEWIGNSASAAGAPYRGKGVYKSTDNGETWVHLPNSNTGVYESFDHRADYITKLVVDPTNGYVYMAAMDAIYRSTDGGNNWQIVLTSGSNSFNSAMATDIVVTSTGRLYAAFAGDCNTGPVNNLPGVWTSTTGNSGSWTKIAGPTAATNPPGWNAAGNFGRVVLAIAPSLESRVYALYYNKQNNDCSPPKIEAEFFYWDQTTSSWTDISANLPDESGCSIGNDPFACQQGFDLVVAVKPDDPATIFLGGTNAYRSTNTGESWTRIGGYANTSGYSSYLNSHPDIHVFAFPPNSSTTMLCANDGGIQRTTNNLASTVTWTQLNTGYRTYQYYYVEIDPRIANAKVIGGAQDNGTTRNINGSGTSFEMIMGGDGVSVGLTDLIGGVQYEYVGFQNGEIIRRNANASPYTGTIITPTGESGSGLFVTLFKLDPDNTQRLYYANDNSLWRTNSASTVTSSTWTEMTGIATAVGASHDITAIALTRGPYSASTSSLFFGTSNGRVFRLDDPGNAAPNTAPVNLTPAGGFPGASGAYVSSIAVNPRNDDTVLVTFSNYGVTSVFWTGNANSNTPTWIAVEGALTLPSYRSCVIHAIPNSNQVQYFVGTSVGLFRSGPGFPTNPGWTQEGVSELGNAPVVSLALRPSDGNLLVGTHGFGMWRTTLSMTPLSADLVEFKGKLQNDKTVLLKWITSSEYENKHFEVEKSTNGLHYKTIATIPAAGNSSIKRYYSFVDKEPLAEINYYRLRIVSNDSKIKLSNTIVVKISDATQEMIVWGNPFRDNITIRFMKPPEQSGNLRLTDAKGKLLAYRTINKQEQLIQFATPSTLSTGIYYITAIIGNQIYTSRVVKK